MMRRAFWFASALILGPAALSAQRPIKVLISVDMEGIGGVVTAEQLGPTGFEYNRFREFMTGEALAAIEGAREAGATQFVVADSHGNMQNLLIDQFPNDVTIIRGSPRPLEMMEGIDSSFSAVMFVGYHSATTNPAGVRAHTISSATFAGISVNGRPMSESSLNAAVAGEFGVPVVLITGDQEATGELKTLLGDVETAVVKRAIGFHAAATMPPPASRALIKAKAKAAIERLKDFKPFRIPGPYRLDLIYKNYTPAEAMALLPGIERVNAHTIRYSGKSMAELSRFIVFATTYRADMTP